ncbi:MAG: hypothetical protein GWN58_26955 [Anaerolineae bacterium]|nr:hypothetical protein [Anaerolineae bacterium]
MLKPGSPEMVAAIIEAGREAGYNDAGLELLAKSRDLHVLIETFSNGRSGVQEPGSSIAGVGGLTEEFYEAVMGEEWTPQRGLKWELQALITYIAELYGGDPMEALQDFALTGSWGGTATLG